MPPRITLDVTVGPLAGQQFTFTEPATCILGRMPDCNVRLPSDAEHRTVSRHHCILDINPPDLRIRDFGSRNGTFVNDELIGQRDEGMTPEEGRRMEFPEVDLKDGDRFRLGPSATMFGVRIYLPAYCADCSTEIPEDERAGCERAPGVFQCPACRAKAEQAGRREAPAKHDRVCAHCGRSVAAEINENRQGEYLCADCRLDLSAILQELLRLADAGDEDVRAIEGYTVLDRLGSGGMGAVFLAERRRTGERVALKVMLPQVACDERAKALFLRETECTRALRHPNIVRFLDAGCSQGIFFLTLEYCEGGSVDRLMERRGGVFDIDEAMAITLQVLDGLEYAHHAEVDVGLPDGPPCRFTGLVHRDVKPQNIFLSHTGDRPIARIGDYGLGKAFEAAGLIRGTRTGTIMGTPIFMPRQQVINYKYAKPEVDVWAAAASLYYMLTGDSPREFPLGRDPWLVILETDPVPIRQRNPSIPPGLAKVIDEALRDDPAICFTSAADFKLALENVFFEK